MENKALLIEEAKKLQKEALIEEAKKLQGEQISGAAPRGEQVEYMTEEPKPEQGTAMGFLDMLESYTTAPAKAAALPVAAKGLAGLKEVPGAFAEQFGKPPEMAPTGKQLAEIAGIPETEIPLPSEAVESFMGVVPPEVLGEPVQKAPASEVAGQALEMGLDPTGLYLGGLKTAYRGAKLAVPAIGAAAKGLAGATGLAAGKAATVAGQEAGEIAGGLVAGYEGMPTGGGIGRAVGRNLEEKILNLPDDVQSLYRRMRPNIQRSFVGYLDLAERKGIPRDLVIENARLLYGREATVTKLKEVGKAFDTRSMDKHDELVQNISSALETEKDNLAGGVRIGSQEATGEAIRDAYNQNVQKLFDENSLRYSTIVEQTGTKELSDQARGRLLIFLSDKLEDQKKALRLAADPAKESRVAANIFAVQKVFNNLTGTGEGQPTLKILPSGASEIVLPQGKTMKVTDLKSFVNALQDRIKGAVTSVRQFITGEKPPEVVTPQMAGIKPPILPPTEFPQIGDLNSVISQLQDVGESAYSTRRFLGEGPSADKTLLKDLYRALKQSVEESVPQEARIELKQSNENLSNFFRQNEIIGRAIQQEGVSGERIYKSLLSSGDSKKLEALKSILGADSEILTQARVQLLDDLFKESVAAASQGDLKTPIFTKILQGLETPQARRVLNALYSPEELNDYKGLLLMGRDVGPQEYNPSRTARVLQALSFIRQPIQEITSYAVGSELPKRLEVSAFKNYLSDLTPAQMIQVSKREMFPPEIFNQALAEKLSEPSVKIAYDQAKRAGTLTPDLIAEAERVMAENGVESYSIVKKYLMDSARDLGVGLFPPMGGPAQLQNAVRILNLYSENQRKSGASIPVRVPEEDKEAVKQAIMQSQMPTLQKMKNMQSLNRGGVLLDVTSFSGLEAQKNKVIRNLMKQQVFEPKKDASMNMDKVETRKSLAIPRE
jgi:hypothetical protein